MSSGPPTSANLARRVATLVATAAALAVSASCGSGERLRDVVYDARFSGSAAMDVYLPDDAAASRPGVLFIHGGAWRSGSRRAYAAAADRLARSGYVAATIDYRMGEAGVYPRAVQDCLCALSHFRAHAGEYGLDPTRVAVMGYSAGGHLASLMGVAADDPLLAPDCEAGPTYAPRAVIAGSATHDLRGKDHFWVSEFLGGPSDVIPAVYAHASPITHVHENAPPYLFLHGGDDWFVDVESSRTMRGALLSVGTQAEIHEVHGGGHLLNAGTDPGTVHVEQADLTAEAWITLVDFLERTVGRPQ